MQRDAELAELTAAADRLYNAVEMLLSLRDIKTDRVSKEEYLAYKDQAHNLAIAAANDYRRKFRRQRRC